MKLPQIGLRSLSGLIYCAIIVGLIFCGKYGVLILSILFSIAGCLEFARMSSDLTAKNIPVILLDIAGCVCLCFAPWIYPLIIWIAIMVMRGIEELYINSAKPLHNLAHSYMSQIYIGVPLAIMSMIAFWLNPMIVLAIFILIWLNDTGAYLVGCTIGKHRLFERISPKKSWEGFFGGLFFCVGISILFNYFCNNFFGMQEIEANVWIWLGMGVIVTVFGTWGDLIESMIKRNLNIKDSSNLIPGHGGILDRIDSLLLVLPALGVYFSILLYLELINPIISAGFD